MGFASKLGEMTLVTKVRTVEQLPDRQHRPTPRLPLSAALGRNPADTGNSLLMASSQDNTVSPRRDSMVSSRRDSMVSSRRDSMASSRRDSTANSPLMALNPVNRRTANLPSNMASSNTALPLVCHLGLDSLDSNSTASSPVSSLMASSLDREDMGSSREEDRDSMGKLRDNKASMARDSLDSMDKVRDNTDKGSLAKDSMASSQARMVKRVNSRMANNRLTANSPVLTEHHLPVGLAA